MRDFIRFLLHVRRVNSRPLHEHAIAVDVHRAPLAGKLRPSWRQRIKSKI